MTGIQTGQIKQINWMKPIKSRSACSGSACSDFKSNSVRAIISRSVKFSSMLVMEALLLAGCATSGLKLPKSYINSDLSGKFEQRGTAFSPAGTEAKYGKDGKGNEVVVVTDGKVGTSYLSERKIKKIKYNKKRGQFKVYYTDGTVEYLSVSP